MSRKFIGFLLGTFILVGGFFFWTLYRGLVMPQPQEIASTPSVPVPPAPPPPPSVTLTVVTARTGNEFVIKWNNLPLNTVALDILRKLKKGTSAWTLWKQISLNPGELSSGEASFNIGSNTFALYDFSIETVGNLADSNGNTTGQSITWTSTPVTPTITVSTTISTPQPSEPGPANPNPGQNPATSTPNTPSTSTAANAAPTGTTPIAGTTTPPAPTGTPYYTPRIQLTGYGQGQSGSFWVDYVDQKIEIGWQNLPTSTDEIVILRASSSDGPWTTVLTQTNVDPTGPSTIQIVDNTLDKTSYYELTAEANGNAVAVYGPVALPPAPR